MYHQPKRLSKLKREENSKNNIMDVNDSSILVNSNMIELSTNSDEAINNKNHVDNDISYYEKRYIDGDYTTNTNSVFTFGSNEMGQLGQGEDLFSPFSFVPIRIPTLNSKKIISISAGDGHSVCVGTDGSVYSWGASACGQLGLDDIEPMPRDSEGYPFQPIPVPILLLSSVKIQEVACGDAHTLALSIDGRVFSWGGAGCGQLGHLNINEMPKDSDNCPFQPNPKIIETLKNFTIKHIACGKAHSLSIDSNGNLYTWGAGACGQLGVEEIQTLPVDDDGYPYQPIPKILKSLKGNKITYGVCGDVHSLILNDRGQVFAFGGGSFGQLGLGPVNKMPLDSDRYPYKPTPTIIEFLSGIFITSIACGDSHSMAIDNEGKLYAWGAAACGQLGLEFTSNLPKDIEGNPYQPEPRLVTFFENIKVTSVACGENHTLVLCEYGLVYSFGGSNCGQLGFPELKDSKNISNNIPKSLQSRINETINSRNEKPRLIISLLGKNIIKMASGGVHNILLVENETPFLYKLYNMFKNERMTDYEIILEKNSKKESTTSKIQHSIKCHSFVLLSRSHYFYNKIINNKEKSQILIKHNFNFIFFKTVIEYLYLDDLSFISQLENNVGFSYNNTLIEYLKIARLLELKNLQIAIENKLKANLSKYADVLQGLLLQENRDTDEDNFGGSLKGLYFLPNGNCMLILNEDLIDMINKNSLVLNLNTNSNSLISNLQQSCINSNVNTKILTQKNLQEQSLSNNSLNKLKLKAGNINTKNTNIKEAEIDEENFVNIVDESVISYDKLLSKNNEKFSKFLLEQITKKENFDLIDIMTKNIFFDTDNHSQIHYDFLKFFNKKETCDLVIKIGSENLYAHKIILANSSKFFEMMLTEEMKETTKNEIVITDFNPEEILMFMLYLYTDCLSLDLERALSLLRPADMFSADLLKIKLENFISSKLEIENAAKIYKFASFYNYDRLKKISLLFINDNYKAVIETSEFEDLHRESMLEIIRFCKSH